MRAAPGAALNTLLADTLKANGIPVSFPADAAVAFLDEHAGRMAGPRTGDLPDPDGHLDGGLPGTHRIFGKLEDGTGTLSAQYRIAPSNVQGTA